MTRPFSTVSACSRSDGIVAGTRKHRNADNTVLTQVFLLTLVVTAAAHFHPRSRAAITAVSQPARDLFDETPPKKFEIFPPKGGGAVTCLDN
jgi:hypothetical protein